MKKEKIKYQTEDEMELKKFGIVLVILIIVIVGIYGLSKILIEPKVEELTYQAGEISTTAMSVGTLFNGPEKEYYVLAYDFDDVTASAYNILSGYYNEPTNGKKIYSLDLSSAFNKDYYVEEQSNPKAQKISDLKIMNGTLIKVQNKKIVKYIEGKENIIKELKG